MVPTDEAERLHKRREREWDRLVVSRRQTAFSWRKRSGYARLSASETVEQREERLRVRRERDRTRHAARMKEEREAALLRMRAYGRSRVASATADDRLARLQELRTNQQERLAVEPADERQARLQQLATYELGGEQRNTCDSMRVCAD